MTITGLMLISNRHLSSPQPLWEKPSLNFATFYILKICFWGILPVKLSSIDAFKCHLPKKSITFQVMFQGKYICIIYSIIQIKLEFLPNTVHSTVKHFTIITTTKKRY